MAERDPERQRRAGTGLLRELGQVEGHGGQRAAVEVEVQRQRAVRHTGRGGLGELGEVRDVLGERFDGLQQVVRQLAGRGGDGDPLLAVLLALVLEGQVVGEDALDRGVEVLRGLRVQGRCGGRGPTGATRAARAARASEGLGVEADPLALERVPQSGGQALGQALDLGGVLADELREAGEVPACVGLAADLAELQQRCAALAGERVGGRDRRVGGRRGAVAGALGGLDVLERLVRAEGDRQAHGGQRGRAVLVDLLAGGRAEGLDLRGGGVDRQLGAEGLAAAEGLERLRHLVGRVELLDGPARGEAAGEDGAAGGGGQGGAGGPAYHGTDGETPRCGAGLPGVRPPPRPANGATA